MPTSNSTTENHTNALEYKLPFNTWITYEVFSVLLTLIAFYLCIVLSYYSYRKMFRSYKKLRRQPSLGSKTDRDNNSSSLGAGKTGSVTSIEGSRKRRSDGTGKAAKPLRVLCLLGAVFALMRVAGDQLELATYDSERIDCKVYQVFIVTTYSLSASCLYAALWVRLRIFFSHPIMHHLTSRFLEFLIWFALFCVLGSAILNTAIFIITVQAVDSTFGCINGQTTSISPTGRYIVLTTSTVATQTLLLSLFLYPIVKHRSTMRSPTPQHSSSRVTSGIIEVTKFQKTPTHQPEIEVENGNGKSGTIEPTPVRKSKRFNREKRLISIIWRVLFTAVVCVASDVLAAVTTIALNDQPRVVTNMIFSCNLLVNLVSVLRSFGDWQERLVPCCASPHEKQSKAKTNSAVGMSRSPKDNPVSPNKSVANDNRRPGYDSSASVTGDNPELKNDSSISLHRNSIRYNGSIKNYNITTTT